MNKRKLMNKFGFKKSNKFSRSLNRNKYFKYKPKTIIVDENIQETKEEPTREEKKKVIKDKMVKISVGKKLKKKSLREMIDEQERKLNKIDNEEKKLDLLDVLDDSEDDSDSDMD